MGFIPSVSITTRRKGEKKVHHITAKQHLDMNMQSEEVSNQDEVILNTKGNRSDKTYKTEASQMAHRMKEL